MNKSILIKLISLTLSLTFIICGFAGCKGKSDTSSDNDSMVNTSDSEDEYKLPEGQVLSGEAQNITIDDRVINSCSGDTLYMQFFDICLDLSKPVGEFMTALKNSKYQYNTTYTESSKGEFYDSSFTITVIDKGICNYTYKIQLYNPFNETVLLSKYYIAAIEPFSKGETQADRDLYDSQFTYPNGSDMRYDFIIGPGGITNGTSTDVFVERIMKSSYFNNDISVTEGRDDDRHLFTCTHSKVGLNYKYNIPGAVIRGSGSRACLVYDMVVDTDSNTIYNPHIEYYY